MGVLGESEVRGGDGDSEEVGGGGIAGPMQVGEMGVMVLPQESFKFCCANMRPPIKSYLFLCSFELVHLNALHSVNGSTMSSKKATSKRP